MLQRRAPRLTWPASSGPPPPPPTGISRLWRAWRRQRVWSECGSGPRALRWPAPAPHAFAKSGERRYERLGVDQCLHCPLHCPLGWAHASPLHSTTALPTALGIVFATDSLVLHCVGYSSAPNLLLASTGGSTASSSHTSPTPSSLARARQHAPPRPASASTRPRPAAYTRRPQALAQALWPAPMPAASVWTLQRAGTPPAMLLH